MTETGSLPVRPTTFEELEALIGRELGPTAWRELDQNVVNAFADATGDHQWIHVDVERAAASPFGGTIAHGLLTLSLGPVFNGELISFAGFAHGLNYGYDKVRFPASVPTGSRVRMRTTVTAAERVPGGIQVRTQQVYEAEGVTKPVCVAESLSRIVEG